MTEFNEELRKYEKNNKYRCGYGYGDEHYIRTELHGDKWNNHKASRSRCYSWNRRYWCGPLGSRSRELGECACRIHIYAALQRHHALRF